MAGRLTDAIRGQLLDRRSRLERTVGEVGRREDLVRLLQQVDAALKRLSTDAFGQCVACGEQVDDGLLLAEPMAQYCLCRLSPEQQSALERDLDVAWRIQAGLLPAQDLVCDGWSTHYRYVPAGPVSGDYLDLIPREGDGGGLYFFVGDVSGKGVAASFLMARLNALLRSLVETGPGLEQIVDRANRLFSEATRDTHYATLVSGRAATDGTVEVCNAGHCPPLWIRGDGVEPVEATGIPVGIFAGSPYRLQRIVLRPGDALVVYTDGLTEARNAEGREYGPDRLSRLLAARRAARPAELAQACLAETAGFRDPASTVDDATILVLGRATET